MPEPDGPAMATNSPAPIVRETSSSATTRVSPTSIGAPDVLNSSIGSCLTQHLDRIDARSLARRPETRHDAEGHRQGEDRQEQLASAA